MMRSSIAKPLRILHLSDTHNMHRQIERKWGKMPPADILLITGDVTNGGHKGELEEFNKWLGEQRRHYNHIFMVLGNHDMWITQKNVKDKKLSVGEAMNPRYMQGKLSNARVLNHELVTVDGLNIFGCNYDAWQDCGKPDQKIGGWPGSGNLRYNEIPHGVDMLLTHVPAAGILDSTGPNSSWGSSRQLRKEIQEKQCRAHLFGHLHEQRGFWQRSSREEDFTGGVEFIADGRPFPTKKPNSTDSPCLLISCNAMAGHGKNGSQGSMAGSARLIVAEPSDTQEGIRFRVVGHRSDEYLHPRSAPAPPRPEPGPSRPVPSPPRSETEDMISMLAKHFGSSRDLVADILEELTRSGTYASPEEVEAKVFSKLSALLDPPNEEIQHHET